VLYPPAQKRCSRFAGGSDIVGLRKRCLSGMRLGIQGEKCFLETILSAAFWLLERSCCWQMA